MSDAFFHRLAASGKIGFGEAYMAEEWRSDDLAGVLSAFATRLTSLVPRPIQRLRRLYEPLQPGHERNTPERRAGQHLAPLRPLERAVRHLP